MIAPGKQMPNVCGLRRDISLPILQPEPYAETARFGTMSDTIQLLQRKMAAAAEALDFEEARRCRDKISVMRGGASAQDAEQVDGAELVRPQPGAMGLGTSRQQVSPPPGWEPPTKPDPMTSGRTRRATRVG